LQLCAALLLGEGENFSRPQTKTHQIFDPLQRFNLVLGIAAMATGIAARNRKPITALPDPQGVDADTDFFTELLNFHFCPRQNSIYQNNI